MWVGIGNMSTILGLVCKYISLSISISIISMVLPFNYADYSVHNTTQNKLLPLFSTQPGYYFWCVVRVIVFVLCWWITSSDGSNDHHTNRRLTALNLKYFYWNIFILYLDIFILAARSTRAVVRRSGALLSTLICSIVRNKTKYAGPKCSVELPTWLCEIKQCPEEGLLLESGSRDNVRPLWNFVKSSWQL